MEQRNEIHVVGAGLAGLTAAAFVARAGLPVVVHEHRRRAGGRAATDERDGFRFNQGPHALYRGGAGMGVLGELGIFPTGAVPPVAGVAVRGGRSFRAPSGPLSLLRTGLLGRRDKVDLARFFATLPRRRAADHADRTTSDWLDGELRRPATRDAVAALVRLSTYVNDPDRLSAEVAISQLRIGARDGVLYLDGGWRQLVDALAGRPGVRIERGDGVHELPDAAAVVVAAGAPGPAGALVDHDFVSGPPAQVACLDLGIRGEPPHAFALGIDEPLYLSKHSIAAGQAPDGCSNVLLAEYLAAGSEPDRGRLERFARTVGIPGEAVVTDRYLHRMVATSAIPTAELGGLAGRPGAEVPDRPGVFVAGDWVGPEGHLADAALASGRAAARAAVRHVQRRPVAL